MISKIIKARRLLLTLALVAAVWPTVPVRAQGSTKMQLWFHVNGHGQPQFVGLTPQQIKHAYGFDQIANQGDGQTIAIVDAFDYPDMEDTLKKFDNAFNLPDLPDCSDSSPAAVSASSPCFKKIFATGTNPGTGNNDPDYPGWALEIAIDVEWAHAIAPRATVLLIEAASDDLDDLMSGVDVAMKYTPSAVSMSWGGSEFSSEAATEDGHFVGKNTTFFASSGDSGHGVIYPAASPFVMGVGATTLNIDPNGNYISETAWSGSGGGISAYELEPLYQLAYPIPDDPTHLRGTPDVAFDGDPNTGVSVYDAVSYEGYTGWFQVGGTSIGPPQWSGLVAIADSQRQNANKPALTGSVGVLYEAAMNGSGYATYHDVTKGNNGTCGEQCTAMPGYDYVTGLGTPKAELLIPALKALKP